MPFLSGEISRAGTSGSREFSERRSSPWLDRRPDNPYILKALFLRRMMRIDVFLETMFGWAWKLVERVGLSLVRGPSGRIETLKCRELEAERLDRLRHPREGLLGQVKRLAAWPHSSECQRGLRCRDIHSDKNFMKRNLRVCKQP